MRVIGTSREFVWFAVLVPLALGLLIRLLPSPQGLSGQPHTNGAATTLLLLLVVGACLLGTATGICEFPRERRIYEHERLSGLSAGAYLCSKVLVCGMIGLLQMAGIVAIGLAGKQLPLHGALIGSALVEIVIAAAVTCLASTLLGLLFSTLVFTRRSIVISLAVVIVLQVLLAGALFPVTGVADWIASVTTARWGMSALAATVSLNQVSASGNAPDATWTHSAAQWLTDMGACVALGLTFALLTWLRLASIGPRRRTARNDVAHRPNQQAL